MFAVSFPGQDALHSIYNSIFSQHLDMSNFLPPVKKFCSTLVTAALGENSHDVTETLRPLSHAHCTLCVCVVRPSHMLTDRKSVV